MSDQDKTSREIAEDKFLNSDNHNYQDELIEHLNKPTQSFSFPKPETIDPDSGNRTCSFEFEESIEGPKEPVDFEKHNKVVSAAEPNARASIDALDFSLAALAQWVAKSKTSKPYRADDDEKEAMIRAAAELEVDYGFKLPAWLRAPLLVGSIYIPKFITASQDKRINELERRMTNMEKKNADKKTEK